MSSNADWKNVHVDSTNQASPYKKMNNDTGKDRKDRKYNELTSDVFGTGAHADFDRNTDKVAFGSTADWTAQGGTQHPKNVGSTKCNTWGRRQNELASQVLPATDYRGHEPMNKAAADMNNWQHDSSVTAKGRKCDEDFAHTVSGQTKLRSDYTGYNAKSQKQGNLTSALDKPVEYVPQEEEPQPTANY